MSKSSKRRLAVAAIKNAADTAHPSAPLSSSQISNLKSDIASPSGSTSALGTQNSALPGAAKSLLQAAAQTASATPAAYPQHATNIRVEAATGGGDRPGQTGVPLSQLGLPPNRPNPNSKTPLLDSARASSILPLNSDLLVPSLPYVLSASPSSPHPSCSELSNLRSDISPSSSAPSLPSNSAISNLKSEIASSSNSPCSPLPSSSEISNLKSASSCETPLLAAARTSLIQSLLPDPALAAITPDQICIELPPLPPDPPSPFTNSTAPTTTQQSPIPPSTPVQDEFTDYQAKLRSAMREWSPADPRIKVMLENYATLMQTVTLERLTSTLTTLSEEAWVETNAQIIRLHSVMERTNSRHSREQREIAAQARREAREQQRKARQVQRDIDNRAKEQRTKERDEQRRQRDKEKSVRADQKHQALMRKLDLKERNLTRREEEKQEKLQHRNSAKPAESPTPAAQKPLGPPNTWTCG